MTPGEVLLRVEDIHLRFGGVTALAGPSFGIAPGTVCGLIGPNGAGKTTIFNCVSRLYTPDSGSVVFDGSDLLACPPHAIASLGIARTFQNLGLVPSLTVRQNVLLGAHHRGKANFATAPFSLPGVRREERTLATETGEILERLQLTEVADRPAGGMPCRNPKRGEVAPRPCG